MRLEGRPTTAEVWAGKTGSLLWGGGGLLVVVRFGLLTWLLSVLFCKLWWSGSVSSRVQLCLYLSGVLMGRSMLGVVCMKRETKVWSPGSAEPCLYTPSGAKSRLLACISRC